MEKIYSKNPATGEVLQAFEPATDEQIRIAFEQARRAQEVWQSTSIRHRQSKLVDLKEVILDRFDEIASILESENGKPRFEAMTTEILPTVDLLAFYAKHARRVLKDERIPMRLMKHRKSILNYWPLGVVTVISPWNYPLYLAIGDIIMAVVAGNAVIFKPSEVTPWIGQKIQQLFEEACFPKGLVQTLHGSGAVGAAIIRQKPAKIFFTGSVSTGKKIMAQASEHLIPVNLELGGKDAMIVMADADLDVATSAALWGGFANSGQVCASVERILVHENIAPQFVALLKDKISRLRHRSESSSEYDLGAITFDKQKSIYETQLSEARAAGATVVAGGNFGPDRTFLEPTIVTGKNIESLSVYNDETFGPVIALTTFSSTNEAIEKANASRYGLLASIYTRNTSLGEKMARQLQVGTVIINDVLYTAGLPETPWGGVKETGFGRTHSEFGLLEFVNVRHIHSPRIGHQQFKNLWWFPYTQTQFNLFRSFLELYRKRLSDKLRALPEFLWNLVQLFKTDRRI